ncbi:hypothetical protein NQ317_004181 [Molorchus minor]|uniref:C2H2-type domain-containing protein n=1 Tax=Molorchus minor TaxID=1323400 RepID=A0ABQ9J743_9CUCU|nr:hypothetical protein NQ317_004181 [Molorchus minor]
MTSHTLGQQICDICGGVHKSLEGLRTHLFHFHNAKKPYTYRDCGRSFKYSHRLTITRGRFFVLTNAETCGKRFFDHRHKKHVKLIHLKLRDHGIVACPYKATYRRDALCVQYCTEVRQLVSLKTHMARYHKDKPSTKPRARRGVAV